MTNEVFLNTISKHLPPSTVHYCFELWQQYKFRFVIKKKRASKMGDYSFNPANNHHAISVNGDLNPYAFLLTYLHEVAHLITQLRYHERVKPHGEEWKASFKEILYPILKDNVFPENIIPPLYDYIANPKATSCSDMDLLKALGVHDEHQMAFLSDIKISETFRFNKKIWRKESIIRTRAVCTELKTKKQYYIPLAAQVEIMQISLF